jgi:UDP-glucose 4-epimerase
MEGCSIVYHLAANADVRFGLQHPGKDLQQNTVATFNVLEAMRTNRIDRIVFTSTGSIYGEPDVHPTPELAPFPVQTSLYGASKLAGEALIQAYAAGFGIRGYIFRFVSILGERYTHGHVYDFLAQLREDSTRLRVLGDGRQRKSYLYVHDAIDAIFVAVAQSDEAVNIFNLGTDDYCEVDQSIEWITRYLGMSPSRTYTGGERGWVGDSPFIFLDTSKIQGLGWRPKLSIREAVLKTVDYLQTNPSLFEVRV